MFSQFTSFLDLIQWRIRRAGFNCVKLDGHMTPVARAATIKRFSEDPEITVFLVSLISTQKHHYHAQRRSCATPRSATILNSSGSHPKKTMKTLISSSAIATLETDALVAIVLDQAEPKKDKGADQKPSLKVDSTDAAVQSAAGADGPLCFEFGCG